MRFSTVVSRFPKLFLFLLSMAPFFIILGLMTMDIPISFDSEACFIGWSELWRNTRVGLGIITISVIIELVIFCMFNRVCEKVAGEQSECVEKIENKNYELISFVTSIFLPLISFQFDQLSHWILMILIVIIVGYIFCKSDSYFTNPTLALFGFRLYSADLSNQNSVSKESRTLIVLSKDILQEGDIIRCYRLTEKVSIANHTKNIANNGEKRRSN